jgi:hypothetical protein
MSETLLFSSLMQIFYLLLVNYSFGYGMPEDLENANVKSAPIFPCVSGIIYFKTLRLLML